MKEMPLSQMIVFRLCNFLRRSNLLFSFEEEEGLIWFNMCGFSGADAVFDTIVEADYNCYHVTVTPSEALIVKPERMARAIEFVSRVNYSVCSSARMDLDVESGLISVVLAVDLVDPPSDEAIRKSIILPSEFFARFYERLKEALEGDAPIEEIVAKCQE